MTVICGQVLMAFKFLKFFFEFSKVKNYLCPVLRHHVLVITKAGGNRPDDCLATLIFIRRCYILSELTEQITQNFLLFFDDLPTAE